MRSNYAKYGNGVACYYVIKCVSGKYNGMYIDDVSSDFSGKGSEYSHIYEIEYAKPYLNTSIEFALNNAIKNTNEKYIAVRINKRLNKWKKWNWNYWLKVDLKNELYEEKKI